MSTPVASDESLPAWADAFAPERLGRAPRLELPADLTREWAFGSGTGAGVRVGVIDSKRGNTSMPELPIRKLCLPIR